VPIPSTESSCSELKDQALPNNDNRFDNKKENMDIKEELGNDTTKEKKKQNLFQDLRPRTAFAHILSL
jgi:hypothetical protein